MKAEIGIIGLGVMGKSLGRNLAQKGFSVALYNRHVPGSEEKVAENFKARYSELAKAQANDDLTGFVQSLELPRKIILMVNAGSAVDSMLAELSKILDKGDIIIDGGNSHYNDTKARIELLSKSGLRFIGAGISGGEEGALKGPSIMPSGDKGAYLKVQHYLEGIAAKDVNGKPCCTYVGDQGSGHFVKMIHNGIEYVEMQLLAECYAILKKKGLANEEIATLFESWKDDLDSYLLDITIKILRKKEGEGYLLDNILDKAGNKGTGNWATVSIADTGEPATLIPAALLARYLSFYKEQRVLMSETFPTALFEIDISNTQLKEAYQFARIINHHQGFSLIYQVSEKNRWQVNLSEIARIWTGGCIIKSDFMQQVLQYLQGHNNLLPHPNLIPVVRQSYTAGKFVAESCIRAEIHAPCLIEAVNYYNGLKTSSSAANLLQAQRDFFGAHTYQRLDDPTNGSYHTEW